MNDDFIKAPIYCNYRWPIEKKDDQYYINAENSKEIIMFFGNGKDKLRSFCVLCNNEESFTTDSKLTFERNGILNNKYLYKINYGGYDLFYKYLPGKEIYLNDFEIKKAYLKLVTITCNYDANHYYVIYYKLSHTENEFIITKIGQNISPYEIGLPKVKKFEKQLKKFDAVDDYKKVHIHRAYGDNIAALLYLRRFFEKMTNKLLDGADLSDNRFETKIKKLREDKKLNPQVDNLAKPVYELLSKGIHELNNDECNELFQSLNLFIEMQLIYIKTEKEKEQTLIELKNDISQKHSKLK